MSRFILGAATLTGLGLLACAHAASRTPPAVDGGLDAGSGAGSLEDAGLEDGGDAGAHGDAGLDAGFDAGPDCGSPLATPDMPCGSLGWTTSSVVSRLRNHQFSFIAQVDAGAFLYTVGGYNGSSILANADRAALQADGSLGAWSAMAPLAQPTAGMAGALVGNVAVIAGGDPGGESYTDQSYSSVVQSDGSLGPWTAAGSTLNARMHAGAFAYGSTVYVLGGFNTSTVLSDVVAATVSADGTLSAWSAAGSLPDPHSHFGIAVVESFVYLVGGLDQSALQNAPVVGEVWRGQVAANGTLGGWTAMTALPDALCTQGAFTYGGYLYTGGGIDNSVIQNGMWRAPIAADHSLGAWEQVASLPIARAHVHQFPLFAGHVYSIAGAIDYTLTSTGEIDIGSFQ
ncbi:MAG TPA: hypothetical protein VMB50_08285 [Myxococcales bacterium]|nr:hypothetical protein [Myxococcales bacterium]